MKDVKQRFSRRGMFIAALVLFTVANVFIQTRRAGGNPVFVSTIPVGEPVPDFAVGDLGAEGGAPQSLLLPASCQLVVVFSASCPFCHKSALAEQRYARGDDGRLPTTWVSETNDHEALEFLDLVSPESRVVYAEKALKKLEIQAVPAALLIGGDGRVVARFAYTGTEDHDAMRGQCEA